MINDNLHRRVEALDNTRHRQLKLVLPLTDWSPAAKLNSIFVAAVEFIDAAREYPLVFVRAGKDEKGTELVAPIAVLGVAQGENLFVNGSTWRASYIPAVVRAYPFGIGRLDDQRFAVCLDMAWEGVRPNGEEGEALFAEDGKNTELLNGMVKHLEAVDSEVHRTRAMCVRLQELGLLRDMRFDAKLPDGREHVVDGFLTVDEAKLQALPDATVLELHRNGMLALINAHLASLALMRRLLEWHVARLPAAQANGAAAAAVA